MNERTADLHKTTSAMPWILIASEKEPLLFLNEGQFIYSYYKASHDFYMSLSYCEIV